jgi:hypothetical protein
MYVKVLFLWADVDIDHVISDHPKYLSDKLMMRVWGCTYFLKVRRDFAGIAILFFSLSKQDIQCEIWISQQV